MHAWHNCIMAYVQHEGFGFDSGRGVLGLGWGVCLPEMRLERRVANAWCAEGAAIAMHRAA
jgi:hypothetical protein